MTLDTIFNDASSWMTLISFVTFLGILLWTFVIKRSSDFDTAAYSPFADEFNDEFNNDLTTDFKGAAVHDKEQQHG